MHTVHFRKLHLKCSRNFLCYILHWNNTWQLKIQNQFRNSNLRVVWSFSFWFIWHTQVTQPKLMGCSENRALFDRNFKIGLFWQFQCIWKLNISIWYCRTVTETYLVMHFHKTVIITWFHDTELWEWLGEGPHNFRRECFSYVPEPNYTNFQQKISMKSFKNDFLNFCEKVSYWI